MKYNVLTPEQKQPFLKRMDDTIKIHDKMVAEIGVKFYEYGTVHMKLTNELIHPNAAKTQKEDIRSQVIAINYNKLDEIAEILQKVREDYVNAVLPKKAATTDPTEIALVEKELEVMTDEELQAFYEDSFSDPTLNRLAIVEHKKRKAHITGAAYIPLRGPGEVKDDVTARADREIKLIKSMRDMARNMFTFAGGISESGEVIPKLVNHDVVFRQIELKNKGIKTVAVSLNDFIPQVPEYLK